MIKELLTSFIKFILEDRGARWIPRLSAYIFGPLLVVAATFSKISGGVFSLDAERPMSVSELNFELRKDGSTIPKRGAAIIIEPVVSQYRIPLDTIPSAAWTSLDRQSVLANRGRITVDDQGLNVSAPFIGVTGPATVVVDGRLGTTIQVPAGSRSIEGFKLESRSASLFVSYVIIACSFSFGLSLATAFSPLESRQRAGRKK
jgi:hypothetical protein